MLNCLVVDLCGTLVRENTTHGFLREARLGCLRRLWARFWVSRFGFALGHLLPTNGHRQILLLSLRGVRRDVLRDEARHYAKRTLHRRGRISVLDEVRQNQQVGVPVMIASASLDVVVEAFAAVLGAQTWVASTLAFDEDGRCLGHLKVDSTARKLELLQRRTGGSLGAFRIITDNPEDRDLMEAAVQTRFVQAHDD